MTVSDRDARLNRACQKTFAEAMTYAPPEDDGTPIRAVFVSRLVEVTTGDGAPVAAGMTGISFDPAAWPDGLPLPEEGGIVIQTRTGARFLVEGAPGPDITGWWSVPLRELRA